MTTILNFQGAYHDSHVELPVIRPNYKNGNSVTQFLIENNMSDEHVVHITHDTIITAAQMLKSLHAVHHVELRAKSAIIAAKRAFYGIWLQATDDVNISAYNHRRTPT